MRTTDTDTGTDYRPKHRAAFPVDARPHARHEASHDPAARWSPGVCPVCAPDAYAARYATHKKVLPARHKKVI